MFVNSGGYGVIGSNGSYTTDILTMDLNNGNVGIGAAPSTSNKLHIQQAKSGSSAENYDLLRFNLTGTGAIGDSSSIVWYSTSGIKTAGIEGVSGQDNILYGELAFNVRRYTTDSFDEAMRINNRGNVGIGTTSPGGKLEVNAQGGGVGGYTGFKLKYGTSSVQSLYMGQVTAGNGCWIGTAQYRSAGYWQTEGTAASVISMDAAGNINFSTNTGLTANTDYELSRRMRITSGGDIQVTGGSFYNSVSGITYVGNNSEFEFVDSLASGTKRFRPGVDNSFDLGDSSRRWDDLWATNPAIQTSDRNEKNTIKETDLGLDFINKLKPVSYIWNNKTRTHYGLIAQDVQEVLKDISKDTKDFAGFIKADISEEKDNSKHSYGLRYNEFISPMIKAIQELKEEIELLKTQING
jgi:hypothetical protein